MLEATTKLAKFFFMKKYQHNICPINHIFYASVCLVQREKRSTSALKWNVFLYSMNMSDKIASGNISDNIYTIIRYWMAV